MDKLPTIPFSKDMTLLDKSQLFSDEAIKKLSENMIQPNFSTPKTPDFIIRNPHEKTEQLLEEANEKYDIQISLLEEQLQHEKDSNAELQKKLDESKMQLRQLNDKSASQMGEIKQLHADLKEESLKRELAENKLTLKDFKGWVWGGLIGAGAVEVIEIIKTIISSMSPQ